MLIFAYLVLKLDWYFICLIYGELSGEELNLNG